MRLSKRIHALANTVIDGHTIADIGTDHGYVPMLLVKSGKCPRAIMSDISEGSLAKARETFALCGLDVDPADFRIGDGLDTVEAGEVDEIIIGGLGGHTIVDILDADISRSKTFKRIVMQPRKHSGTLRCYLYTHGWDIESEQLAEEGKFACEIITAIPVEGFDPDELREAPYPEEDIRWKYPKALMDADSELAAKRLSWKITSIEEQIRNMEAGKNDHSETIDRLKAYLDYLRDLI